MSYHTVLPLEQTFASPLCCADLLLTLSVGHIPEVYLQYQAAETSQAGILVVRCLVHDSTLAE